jgi:hypothetical protein
MIRDKENFNMIRSLLEKKSGQHEEKMGNISREMGTLKKSKLNDRILKK